MGCGEVQGMNATALLDCAHDVTCALALLYPGVFPTLTKIMYSWRGSTVSFPINLLLSPASDHLPCYLVLKLHLHP